MRDDFDYDSLSPGIRDIVRELHRHGYHTTDSGDGTNFKEGMEGALPMRHVFGVLLDGENLRTVGDDLLAMYPAAKVEVSYSPNDGQAVFAIFPDGEQ